jgi:signal transduction histidine kinase
VSALTRRLLRTPGALFGLALVAILATAWMDHVVGVGLSLAPFYLAPIAVVTWFRGRWPGFALAVLSTLVSLAGDITHVPGFAISFTPYWNAGVRLLVFCFLVLLLGRLRDLVEEERRAAQLVREAAEAMRTANQLKTTFMQALSHDIRSPVTSIVGNAATLEHLGDELTAEQRTALVRGLARSSRRVQRLIEDLIDLERVQSDRLDLQCEPVDVGELARRVVAEADLDESHPVTVVAEDVVADVDRVMVERILSNLVSNAKKHLGPGVPLWIRAEMERGGLVIAVEDAGPGVPEELKGNVFQPYWRGDTPDAGGLGIGLSLVAGFAQVHGGRAWVEDRPGGGSSFRVWLAQQGSRATNDGHATSRQLSRSSST